MSQSKAPMMESLVPCRRFGIRTTHSITDPDDEFRLICVDCGTDMCLG